MSYIRGRSKRIGIRTGFRMQSCSAADARIYNEGELYKERPVPAFSASTYP